MIPLVRAELLKLRRRRALMAWCAVLTAGAVGLLFAVQAARHAGRPQAIPPAGSVDDFEHAMFMLSQLGAVAAIMIGCAAGAGDRSAGVFRDLVATGRSRVRLFAARVVAVLLLVVPLGVLTAVEGGLLAQVLAGGLPTADTGTIAASAGWIALTFAVCGVLATGVASLFSGQATPLGLMLGGWIVASRLLMQVTFLGSARYAIPLSATERLAPFHQTFPAMPVVAAAAVCLLWPVGAALVGGWRTATADA